MLQNQQKINVVFECNEIQSQTSRVPIIGTLVIGIKGKILNVFSFFALGQMP